MPRLVRRQPLLQRVSAAINPWDFLLWLSEEIETRELDSPAIGSQVGLAANFIFLLARANLGSSNSAYDDVFGDDSGVGWISYLIQLLVWTGIVLSAGNTITVLLRKRHYRLFEANIDKGPSTPSASRVRVQSSPATNSPLRFINDLIGFETAESRAHPDGTRDVWELAVWDPRPASLALLSFFSPLHILIYVFELPLDPLEPRPSVAVFKCLVLQVGLSLTMRLLQAKNDQRLKDNAIIQKEVLHEYDTKFVQPRLNPIVRDMGTQVSIVDAGTSDAGAGTALSVGESVEFGTPTTLIRRSFQTHPNANYMKHIDPEFVAGASATGHQSPAKNLVTSRLHTPTAKPARYSDSFTPVHSSATWSRQSIPAGIPTPGPLATAATPVPLATAARTPATSASSARGLSSIPMSKTTNFGGSMGVFSHADSPLKKAISMNDLGSTAGFSSPRNSREAAAVEQHEAAERMQRRTSPVKKESSRSEPESRLSFNPQELSSPPVPFNPFAKTRPGSYKYERFPSRR